MSILGQQPLFAGATPHERGDITARKHGGNARSIEANERVDKARQHRMILEVLGNGEFTCEEIAKACGTLPHKISGRFKYLRETAKKIEYTGEKRGGGNVYRLAR